MRGWIVRLGIIGVIAIGGLIFRDRLSSNAGDLQVGDCFDVPTRLASVKDVQHHPCTEGHTAEVFAQVTHPAAKGTAPLNDAALADYIGAECGPIWLTYVGQAAAQAGNLDFGAFLPTDDDWVDGERAFTCYTYRIDRAPMTSSVKR